MNERYDTLELRRDNDVLWLVLNRPAALNAMNRPAGQRTPRLPG